MALDSSSDIELAQYAGTQEAKWKYAAQPSLLVGHVPTGGARPDDYIRLRVTPEGRLEVVVSGTLNTTFPNTLDVNIIGQDVTVDVNEVPYSDGLTDASITPVPTAGTPINLPSGAAKLVLLFAPSTNTGIVYWGIGAGAGAKNEIMAGGHVALPIDNANLIWLDASVDGEGVRVTVLT